MQPLKFLKPFKLYLTYQETALKLMNGCCCTAPYAKKKNLRILFSENVVIVQSSSKCPGLSVCSVTMNKACRFAVVFAHEGISEL